MEFEYLDAEGNWNPFPTPRASAARWTKFNKTTFDPITTTALRVKLNKQSNDSNGVGIMEWKVYGKVAGSGDPPDCGEGRHRPHRCHRRSHARQQRTPSRPPALRMTSDLTDEKKLVPNYETLTKAEETYAALADAAAVKEVEDLIDAIGTVDENSKDAIEAARAAYDALPTRLQPEVSNYDKLVKAEKDYTDLLTAVEAAQKAAGMPARHSRTPRLRRRGRSREGCRRGRTEGRRGGRAGFRRKQQAAKRHRPLPKRRRPRLRPRRLLPKHRPVPRLPRRLPGRRCRCRREQRPCRQAAAKAAEEAAKSR